jgi:hypothetical protein
MDITITTPGLLFPAISLLLLAYTNRFLAIAALIRSLHDSYLRERDQILYAQIQNLRRRVRLIRDMQACGVGSILLCVLCMMVLFLGYQVPGKMLFAASLVLMVLSLSLSLLEINLSVGALNLHLKRLEKHHA